MGISQLKSKPPILASRPGPDAARLVIGFASTSRDPFLPSFLSIASAFLGVRFVNSETASNGSPIVVYGEAVSEANCFAIPRSSGFTRQSIPVLKLPLDSLSMYAREFPFDLIKAIEFWITDQAHLHPLEEDLDRHRRIRPERTLAHQLRVTERPMVNAYLLAFKHWLEAKLGFHLPGHLPSGRKCMVMLSHDVDTPVNPSEVGHDLWRIGWCAMNGHWATIPRELIRVARKLKHRRTSRHEKHWLFDEIAAAEARHGFSSSYFFSAIASPTSRHGYDVAYDIRSPRFKRLFRTLQSLGFEVGLHGSYRSSEAEASFRSEMHLLRHCSDRKVFGNRQHCWKMLDDKWKTLGFMANAGLAYDSSIAFNDIPGFRLGIAFPFYPYCPATQKAIPIMELPVMLMDGAYFYHAEPGVDEVVRNFRKLLEQLKHHGGVGAIDWHVTTAFPGSQRYRKWGEAYLAILEALASDPEVAVMNCAMAYEYYRTIYDQTGGFAT